MSHAYCGPRGSEGWFLIGGSIVAIALGWGLAMRLWLYAKTPRAAMTALAGAYIANGVLCLWAFREYASIGWYITCLAMPLLALESVFCLRRAGADS